MDQNFDLNNIFLFTSECKSHQFSCSNKRCITMSYRCDGFNDCGCVADCDEQNCGGISMCKSRVLKTGVRNTCKGALQSERWIIGVVHLTFLSTFVFYVIVVDYRFNETN